MNFMPFTKNRLCHFENFITFIIHLMPFVNFFKKKFMPFQELYTIFINFMQFIAKEILCNFEILNFMLFVKIIL